MASPIIFVEEAIRTHALQDAALANLVGDRFYMDVFQQGDDDPSILLSQISGVEELAHDGPAGLCTKRFQMTIRSNCLFKNIQIAARLKKIFHGFSGRLANEIQVGRVQHAGEVNLGQNPGENIRMYATDFVFVQRVEQ